jgi:hypothetical protein
MRATPALLLAILLGLLPALAQDAAALPGATGAAEVPADDTSCRPYPTTYKWPVGAWPGGGTVIVVFVGDGGPTGSGGYSGTAYQVGCTGPGPFPSGPCIPDITKCIEDVGGISILHT